MTHPESLIRYSPHAMPDHGDATPIAPGVFWLRMPLPFALNHINLWLLEDELDGRKGWTVVDTGVSTDEVRAAWHQVIAHHFKGLPILRVVCTHFHPDHIGLASWLCKGTEKQLWEAPLWINFAEYVSARIWNQPPADDRDTENTARHFDRHGITDLETLNKLRMRRGYYPNLVPEVPMNFRRIFPHEDICIGKSSWRVIPGYGHSPEHCALYNANQNLLISGDMVLPKISTNMLVMAQEPDANPLKLYLDSLRAYESLPDDVLVLPSHGKPFGADKGGREGGIKVRLEQLHEHHRERLDETLEACVTPKSAAEVMPILFKRELDLHQLTFAFGETIAHLNYLWHSGELIRLRDDQGRLTFVKSKT
jgi:glyoxylase-like metal-dependent hydrolase (beta-lactamase superfamily II)